MGIFRNLLLWGSENPWMRTHVPQFKFVKRAVKRFMPGEEIQDAIEATRGLNNNGIPTTFTRLGENLTDLSEARLVTNHYLYVLEQISKEKLNTEISVKLTQLGFDLSIEKTLEFFSEIAEKAKSLNNTVFIDMEGSAYTQSTIDFYKRVKSKHSNVGICLQAYLYRTQNDLEDLFPVHPTIRLVKGAYNEPTEVAYPKKSDVDNNYFTLAKLLLEEVKTKNIRAAFATHDENLVKQISDYGMSIDLPKDKIEFQMLYGIKSGFQSEIKKLGFRILVLISYGQAWFPWYMRRLAERPANVTFVLKSMFSR